MEEFGDVRLFVRIVVAGTLSDAARKTGMSLTAVSRRLAALEDRLGVRLVDRASRKFELSDEGRLFYAHARRIIDDLDAAVAELDRASGIVRGNLRISAPNAIGRRVIAPLCREFAIRHEAVSVDLSFSDARPHVPEEGLDVAVVTRLPNDGDIIYRKLLTSRRVVCASPAYIAECGRPDTPADLAGHRCIVTRRGDRLYDAWTLMSADGPREQSVIGRLVCDSTDIVHQWALDGAGIAVKALWDIEEDLKAGRLVELLAEYACDPIALYATHLTRRHIPPRVRLFVDLLAERVPTMRSNLA